MEYDENEKPYFEFKNMPELDRSTRHVLDKIVPLCTWGVQIQHFVDIHGRDEYGLVDHALASSIRNVLKV